MGNFISPKDFSQISSLSYDQVLVMCKKGEIKALKSPGGHFKIFSQEIERLTSSKDNDYITKEEYMKVVRENERLKITLENIKSLLAN